MASIMECSYYMLLMLVLVTVNGQGDTPTTDNIPPTVHQVLLLDPIPIANLIGRDVLRLECSASGNPAPTITWSFNGVVFKDPSVDDPDKRRFTIKGNRLTVYDIKGKSKGDPKYYDSGRYRCVAANTVGIVFLEKNIQIRVMGQFLPGSRYQDDRKKWNPTVGRSFQIKCPHHTIGYGTEYRWGVVPESSNQPQFWLPGQVNRKLFNKLDGTLVWAVIAMDDIKESLNAGLRCILINFGQFTASNQQVLWQAYATVTEYRKPIIEARLAVTMSAAVNSEFRLVCGATGNPPPTYHWQYQGQDIVSRYNTSDELNFEFFQFLGHQMELRIRRVTRYSGGTFKCFAKNKMGEVWSIGQLSVSFPPKWVDKFVEYMEIPLNNRFELVCNATGFPYPTIEWFQNSTKIINDKTGRKIVTGEGKDDKGGKLILTTAKYEDNGIYICVASNELDTLTMSVNIKIEAKPPKFKIPIDDPIYLFRTETMYVNCTPAGGPPPEMKWFVNDTAVEDGFRGGRFKSFKNGTLRIKNVKYTDNGLYRCDATNSMGKDTSSGHSFVLEPTIIDRPPESLSHLVGWPYTVMYCGATWDPRLDLRIEWYKGGVRMAKFSDLVFLEERAKGPPRLLYIMNLTIYDAGVYSCHAYSKVGNIISDQWKNATLRIKGAPMPPAGVSIKSGMGCLDNIARLEWSRGEELMEETRYFFIEFSTNTSSLAGKWFGGEGDPLIPNSAIVAEPGTRVSMNVKNLVPGANLIFRIKAKSQFAIGKPSRPSRSGTCITLPGPPQLNPLNVTGITSGPGTLSIRWRMVMDVYHGATGFFYEINYKTDDQTGFTTFVEKDANVTQFEIPTPGIYRKYTFNVQSKNSKGSAPKPKNVVAFSGRQPPVLAPTRFRAWSISRFTVNLRWNAVTDATGYRVRYYNITDAEHFRGRSRRGADDPIEVKFAYFLGHEYSDGAPLSNLTAQVEFIASVAALNNGGVGPESYEISFTTEARVPGIPSNVKLVVYGDAIHLSWHPPINPNGYIEQYVISWYESDKERRKKKLVNQKLSFDRRSREAYLIAGQFIPFVYYDIKLMARNRVGPGNDWQRERVVVSAPDIPGKGGAPLAVPFDDSKINITYQRPGYGGLPTTIYIFYRPKGHYFQPAKNMSTLFPKRAWILITELEFLVYDFWTVGVNKEGQSETSDVTEMQAIRRPKGKQAHASPFEWWRSNWFIAIAMCVLFVLITAVVVIMLLRPGPVPYARIKEGKEDKTNGYHVAGVKVKAPVDAIQSGTTVAVDVEATRKKELDEKRPYVSASDEPQSELDNPPPRYSSQSSLEKKERSGSETASHSGTGSQYSESESESASGSGSEYSDGDEEQSEYTDEEKKRESSGEEEDYHDDDLAAFV